MDMMTAIFAANKAKKDLMESGQIGGEETNETKVIEIQEREFTNGKAGFSASAGSILADLAAVRTIGHINTVYFDGVRYECQTRYRLNADGTEKTTQVVLGNAERLAGIGDSGEPFAFMFYVSSDSGQCFYLDEYGVSGAASTHTVGLFDIDKTVHTIDPKYLPASSGGGLPVVELETVATLEGAELSAADVAKIEALGFNLPFVLKCTANIYTVTVICTGLAFSEQGMMSAGGYFYALGDSCYVAVDNISSGTWKIYTDIQD